MTQTPVRPKRFYIQTLGCPKNTVDSETIEARLLVEGYLQVDSPQGADVVVVNTCGFIDRAKEESINALLQLSRRKRRGQQVIAAGCLTERYGEALRQEIPELDAVVGIEAGDEIAALVRKAEVGPALPWQPHRLSKTRASAYLKVADGCSAPCSFCIIPKIKGPWRSKPMEQIMAEARSLVASGVREIVLVSQDTTAYGYDWGKRDLLPDLLERILETVPELPWLRIMYAYPGHVTKRLIQVMGAYPQICSYIDIPLQHGHPEVLKRMRRPSFGVTKRTLLSLREVLPDVALRTAFIVGSPSETEEEFQGLLDFMSEMQFDRAGVFTYSQEEGTPLAEEPGQLPDRVKRQRRHKAMLLQQSISLERNRRWVGRELEVLVEGTAKGRGASQPPGRDGRAGVSSHIDFVGRSFRDAPEVDGLVLGRGPARAGDLVRVHITQALEYDLVGEVA